MKNKTTFYLLIMSCFFAALFSSCKPTDVSNKADDRPNVILVITDDQGYGDLACHGNPLIKTPNLDKFHSEAVRLTDFHVGPTCAPTRAGLMTGRSANRTGVWHTIGGCSILRKEEVTVANVLKDGGYETAMFGKWHLGDNYPSRPQDKGFNHVVSHGGGGVGQTPDYWNNDYFDDTYLVNGEPKKFEGYCTDVWFDEAINFIETNKEKPFFCYISTNAPHSPFNVPIEYYNQYKDLDIPEFQKRFYGMITNVDDNFKKLEDKLNDLGIADNTILIFMTDNGTSAGYKKVDGKLHGFNAGMKGTKNSEYEGGHRVPFFIKYTNGNIKGGKDVTALTANVDLLPTLTSLCNLKIPNRTLDGMDISKILTDEKATVKRKYLITDSQRMQVPTKWHKSAVMVDKWRLVNGKELYDISQDAGQENDLAATYPEKVATMRGHYDEWWNSVSEKFEQYPIIVLGAAEENPMKLTCHDVHIHDSKIPWHQNFVRNSPKNPYGGAFVVDFAESGRYRFELSRWAPEADLSITATVEGRAAAVNYDEIAEGKSYEFVKGGLQIGDWKEEKAIAANAKKLTFEGDFEKGQTELMAWFTTANNENWGSFYINVERLD